MAEYNRLRRLQQDCGILTLFCVATFALLWYICGDYEVGKLFVLFSGWVCVSSSVVAWAVVTVQKAIVVRKILRNLRTGGGERQWN